MPKVIIGVVAILIVAYIVSSPSQAASLVHGGWGHTKSIAHGLDVFVNKL